MLKQKPEKTGTLYIVGTPIGNLEDITLRALRILKEVDLIAAEDTRRTRKLLSYYDIHTSLISYHDYSKQKRTRQLVEYLLEEKNIALVSDAGTPCKQQNLGILLADHIKDGPGNSHRVVWNYLMKNHLMAFLFRPPADPSAAFVIGYCPGGRNCDDAEANTFGRRPFMSAAAHEMSPDSTTTLSSPSCSESKTFTVSDRRVSTYLPT